MTEDQRLYIESVDNWVSGLKADIEYSRASIKHDTEKIELLQKNILQEQSEIAYIERRIEVAVKERDQYLFDNGIIEI